jgi:hypothetical protein
MIASKRYVEPGLTSQQAMRRSKAEVANRENASGNVMRPRAATDLTGRRD